MIRSLYSGVSGLRNHQVRMDTLSNNIANVNTTGFKASRANFEDALSQLLRGGGSSRNPMQTGTGIATASIGIDTSQGPLQMTGRTLDTAIQGNGYFKVSDGTNTYYTRDGAFFIDSQNTLVDSQGLKVQQANGGGDIVFSGTVTNLSIDSNGQITYYTTTSPDTPDTSLSIGVTTFDNPEGLQKAGDSLYQYDQNVCGNATDSTPGQDGAGTVQSGYLEMSNTDLSTEFTNMITTQRGYQANARVITVSDTLLQELIDLKRQ